MNEPERIVKVYRDEAGEWRWRRIATANGDIVGDSSEGYVHKYAAVDAAHRENAGVPVEVLEDDADQEAS